MGTAIKEKAIELRLLGKSYSEIGQILKISSKGTLSYWLKNITLSPPLNEKLDQRIVVARKKGLFKFNNRRSRLILKENKQIFSAASRSIKNLTANDLLLIGTALYWAEGTKSEKHGPSVTFSNSDPDMTAIFLRFVREVLKVPNEKIKPGIQIHPNIDERQARIFWSNVIKLPPDKFYITKQISSATKFKRASRFLPCGTVTINIHSRPLFQKIKGYIYGLARKI